jgi:hypothetical protein
VQREDQYKKFFKDYESNMQDRMKIHVDKVLISETERQSKLSSWTNKNEMDYKRKLDEKFLNDYQCKMNDVKNTGNTLSLQIEEKRMKKDYDKMLH